MNNYCRNCGEKIPDNTNVCPKCYAEVFDTRVDVEKTMVEEEQNKKKEKIFVVVIISLFASSFLISFFNKSYVQNALSTIESLLSLAGIVTLIYARITLNNSKIIKILFIIMIVIIVGYFLMLLLIVLACVGLITGGCQ